MITTSKFKIYTLVDITNTKERNPKNNLDYKRHQNYQTLLNTLGLRSNPIIIEDPVYIDKPKDVRFGSNYKDIEQCFCFDLEGEYANAFNLEFCVHDFNLVPIFSDMLDSPIDPSVFDTTSRTKKNIVFIFDK